MNRRKQIREMLKQSKYKASGKVHCNLVTMDEGKTSQRYQEAVMTHVAEMRDTMPKGSGLRTRLVQDDEGGFVYILVKGSEDNLALGFTKGSVVTAVKWLQGFAYRVELPESAKTSIKNIPLMVELTQSGSVLMPLYGIDGFMDDFQSYNPTEMN